MAKQLMWSGMQSNHSYCHCPGLTLRIITRLAQGRGACGKVFLCLNTYDLKLYAMKVSQTNQAIFLLRCWRDCLVAPTLLAQTLRAPCHSLSRHAHSTSTSSSFPSPPAQPQFAMSLNLIAPGSCSRRLCASLT